MSFRKPARLSQPPGRFAGGISALIVLFIALPAHAQIQTHTPPASSTVDGRGVDIVSGEYTLVSREVSIGPAGAGGLVHGRRFAGTAGSQSWRDLLAGTLKLERDGNGTVTGAIVSLSGASAAMVRSCVSTRSTRIPISGGSTAP